MKLITEYPINIIFDMPPVLSSSEKCSIDLEMFKMENLHLHRPTLLDGSPNGKFACLTLCWNGIDVYFITDEKDVQQALDNVKDATLVFHNAKFDVTHIRRWAYFPKRLKKFWDTMLIEQIRFSGYYDKFSLGDVVRRYLKCYIPKDVRDNFQDETELNDDLIKYSAYDCLATWHVYKKQREQIDRDDLNVWATIELPFLWTILGMSGIKLDVDKWTKLALSNKEKSDELQEKYSEINLASPAQVKKELHKQGHKANSTGVEILEGLKDKCEFANDVLNFRTFSKRASTYGLSFIEKYVEHDGTIHSDIYQIGAYTARTSSRNPNLQNQISDTEYRECYIADDEDSILCIADWGSQEPRFAAFLSQDNKLIDALNSSEKLYIRIARDALGININKSDKEYTHMKSTILGIFYGMSPKGLSQRLGVSENDASRMINTILNTYPGIRDYINKQRKAKDYVTSVCGRKIWLNKYSYQWERVVLNAPIQSSAGDAMKISAYKVCEAWDKDFYDNTPLKLLVHDELGAGVHKSGEQTMARILNDIMVSVSEKLHPGISAIADVGCANSWADAKH